MTQGFVNNGSYNNTLTPNRNIIIGGNFDTNPWQRGTSTTGITGTNLTTYVPDRFGYGYKNSGVVTYSRATDAPSVSQANFFSTYCLSHLTTTADTSFTTDKYAVIRYNMEGYDWTQIAQRSFTLSFWVKSTKTGQFYVAFNSGSFDASYIAPYTINSSNTWEKKTITVSASPSATGTWNYTNSIGMVISFVLATGPTFQTSTTNSWISGNYLGTSSQVNAMDTVNNNFKLALVKVEAGSFATDYPTENPSQVLAACQRYYAQTLECSADGYNTGGINISGRAFFKTTMRAAPTISSISTIESNNMSGSGASHGVDTNGATIYQASSAGGACFAYWTFNASAEF